jgi:hypothetical protein
MDFVFDKDKPKNWDILGQIGTNWDILGHRKQESIEFACLINASCEITRQREKGAVIPFPSTPYPYLSTSLHRNLG